jgi:hypothetical protein
MTRYRICPVVLLGALLAGCSSGPRSFVAPTPQPIPDAYSCALSKVNELGYTVTNTNKESGFITGTKQTSGFGTKFLTGSEYHDQLTVSIFDQQGSTERTIRVTAGRVDRRSNLFGTSTNAVKPTEAGVSDARVLLTSCGKGTITEQTEFGLHFSGSVMM